MEKESLKYQTKNQEYETKMKEPLRKLEEPKKISSIGCRMCSSNPTMAVDWGSVAKA